jgi:hypothetical protein
VKNLLLRTGLLMLLAGCATGSAVERVERYCPTAHQRFWAAGSPQETTLSIVVNGVRYYVDANRSTLTGLRCFCAAVEVSQGGQPC